MDTVEIGKAEKKLIKLGVKIVGSQNGLARLMGYYGRNAGCQINYFLCGTRKYMPVEKLERLKRIVAMKK